MSMRKAIALLIVGSLVALVGCVSSTSLIAQFSPNPSRGRAPLRCSFDGAASYSPEGTITAYMWDFGDGHGHGDSGPEVTHTYSEKGTFSVLLTVFDATGASASVSHNVQVEGYPPVASFFYSPETNSGVPITFDGSASSDSDGQVVEWVWSLGDGTIDEGEVVSHTYEHVVEPTVFTVTLTVKDDDGDTGFLSKKVTVYGCNCGS